MKHLKVVLYDESSKMFIEHDEIPEGELIFSGGNDAIFVDMFMKVDELLIGSQRYSIVSRTFSIGAAKLIIGVRPKN